RDSVEEIGQSVDHQNPHGEEMPLQRALRLAADRDPFGKMQPAEHHFVVVNFPSAADHDEHGNGVGPMHDPQWKWMKSLRLRHISNRPWVANSATRQKVCRIESWTSCTPEGTRETGDHSP